MIQIRKLSLTGASGDVIYMKDSSSGEILLLGTDLNSAEESEVLLSDTISDGDRNKTVRFDAV